MRRYFKKQGLCCLNDKYDILFILPIERRLEFAYLIPLKKSNFSGLRTLLVRTHE